VLGGIRAGALALGTVRLTPSVGVLAAANAIPVAGVLGLGWDVFPLMLLYWIENLIVGGFNVLRMVWAQPRRWQLWLGKVFMVPFFVFHFGLFTTVHGIFLFAMFGRDFTLDAGPFPPPGLVWSAVVDEGVIFGAAALALSHGFSFAWNYVGQGEFRTVTLDALMRQPYRRVVILHVAIIFGGFAVLALGSRTAPLLLLVALKVGVDVASHLRERRRLAERSTPGAGPRPRNTVSFP
jgi:hypothetical protein